ncbi:YsnF/AvaK domain-containing protein [Fundicoccus culcitae]|uniref:YsnF/AvaK domain-containing protein n=1 Tax=Fundicoccus culcitae TaxID=2969821 RepID=A0ABY5P8S4_9LACT|nr:YsnF/AvaK domain-containing protein [Fundicoccus culcitae]UUX35142.1 YsnF/AvaK domain-containing protein [Fundicoccus culcitae]
MARKYVYGVYQSVTETEDAVRYILDQGVPRTSVSVVGDTDHGYNGDVEFTAYRDLLDDQEDNRGFFARLFNWDDDVNSDEFVNVDFNEYRDSLDRGDLLVLIDQDYEDRIPLFNTEHPAVDDSQSDDVIVDDVAYGNQYVDEVDYTDGSLNDEMRLDDEDPLIYDTDYTVDDDVHLEDDYDGVGEVDLDADTDRIRLHEERVHADVRRKEDGEVHISKEIVEDTETIEVPVEREEIHIRRTTPTEGMDDEELVEEDIVIPVSEEEVVLSKDTVVTDEFEVEKTRHTDHETVTETTRREELDIDDVDGHVVEDDEAF